MLNSRKFSHLGRPAGGEPDLAMLRRWSLVAGFMGALAGITPAAATDRFTVRTNYYTVTGASLREVHESLVQRRPWRTNLSFYARTDWEVKWTSRFAQHRQQFRLQQFNLDTRVTMLLPRWTPPEGVDSEVARHWQEYLDNLLAHESGHVSIARQAARNIRNRVNALAGYGSGAALRKAVERAVDEVLDQAKRQEREYDQRTGHGATQGAVFRRFHRGMGHHDYRPFEGAVPPAGR